MATYYVSSVIGNSDANSGATWTLAKATVAGALAVATTTGDIIYVDSAHVFAPAAAITWDVGTAGQRVQIISVNRNGSTTTGHSGFLAGAKETVGSNAQAFTIGTTRGGVFYIFGMYIEANNGASSSNVVNFPGPSSGGLVLTCESCTISTPGTGAQAEITFGTISAARQVPLIKLKDCTFIAHSNTSSAGGVITTNVVELEIINPTFQYAGANKPPSLFRPVGTCQIKVIDGDISGFNSGQLVLVTDFYGGDITFASLKKSGTPTVVSGTWPASNASEVIEINTDSADTKTVLSYRTRLGTLLSTESVYRTTATAFQIGSVGVGWQIVTTSACNEGEPFVCSWLTNGFDTNTSAKTGSVKIIHDSATNLHNRNCWIEYEYVSSASFPIGTLGSGRNVQPFDGTSVDLASDSDTWSGVNGTSFPVTTTGNKQKVTSGTVGGTTTFTPAEGSAVMARLFVGVATKTLYVDPQVIVA